MNYVQRIETVRASYRPDRITTLFLGESAPSSCEFFYYGGNPLWREMKKAFEAAFGPGGDFLERFKAYGWYLDDLVLTPFNDLPRAERERACRKAQDSLRARIAEYRPHAIVCLLLSIREIVKGAALVAGSDAPVCAVPFPPRFPDRFRKKMATILPDLPRDDWRENQRSDTRDSVKT